MTNFRRAIAALITFIAALGFTVGIGRGVVSAHTASVTGVATCVDLKTGTYSVTWTADPTEDRFQYSITQAGWAPAGNSTWTGKTAGVYPNSVLTETVAASVNPATKTATLKWRDSGQQNAAVTQDHSGSVARPANCPPTPVTPAVTYTPPTCFAVGTVVGIPGTGYTWASSGTTSVTLTATALPGYSLTQSVFGPYNVAQVTGEPCKVISTPVAPTVTRTAVCAQLDSYTAGPTVGVLYNGQASLAGTLAQGQVVQIVATPAPGYKFTGQQSVTFPIEGGAVEVCETTTTTTPATTTTTTIPATTTTVPTPCVYDVSLPADSPLCKAPPTTTVPPAVCVHNPAILATDAACVPPVPFLPATGKGDSGLIFGAILLAAGIVASVIARRPRRHA